MSRTARRWTAGIALAVAIAVTLFCVNGYAMCASFSVSNPDRYAYWRFWGMMYAICTLTGAATAVASSIYLLASAWRTDGVTPAGG